MKIIPNISELYRQMKSKGIETVRNLSRESGIDCGILYSAFEQGVASKVTYWKLAEFFGCHIEDLQIPDYSEKKEVKK